MPCASTPPPVRWERNYISLIDGKLILRLCSRRCVTSSSSSTSTATVKSGHIFHFNFSTFSAAEFLIRCRVKDKVATDTASAFLFCKTKGRAERGRVGRIIHAFMQAAALLLMSICFYSSLSSSSFYFIRISLTWKYPVGLLLLLLLLLLEVIHWAMTMPPPPLQNDDEFLLLLLPFHILMRLLQLQIVAELRECPQQFRDRPLGAGWRRRRRRKRRRLSPPPPIGSRKWAPFPSSDSLSSAPLSRPLQFGSPLQVISLFSSLICIDSLPFLLLGEGMRLSNRFLWFDAVCLSIRITERQSTWCNPLAIQMTSAVMLMPCCSTATKRKRRQLRLLITIRQWFVEEQLVVLMRLFTATRHRQRIDYNKNQQEPIITAAEVGIKLSDWLIYCRVYKYNGERIKILFTRSLVAAGEFVLFVPHRNLRPPASVDVRSNYEKINQVMMTPSIQRLWHNQKRHSNWGIKRRSIHDSTRLGAARLPIDDTKAPSPSRQTIGSSRSNLHRIQVVAEFFLFLLSIDRSTLRMARTARELQRQTERNKLMNEQQEGRKEEEPRIEVVLISGRLKVLTRHIDKCWENDEEEEEERR